jgi:DNA-binding MarR family transcriptional regulator
MQDRKTIIEHGILDLIDQDGRVTQTQLATSLSISLGLLNAYLKRLIKKGYVKTANFKASNIKYVLTPEGIALKYKLTKSYMTRSLDYYRKIKQAVEYRILRLKLAEIRSVVFIGANEISEITHLYLSETKIELLGVFDDINNGKEFFGHTVYSIGELNDFLNKNAVEKILINEFENIEVLHQQLLDQGIDNNIIEYKW